MIKVAFWYDRPLEYTGGLNYIYNLLHAISIANAGVIQPFVFFGRGAPSSAVNRFERVATVVRTAVLDRKSLPWYAHQLLFRIFGSVFVMSRVLRPHGISMVSHAEHIYGRNLPFTVISWIPDFQYLHLPEFFPGLDVDGQTRRLRQLVAHADAIVLSSYAALADFKRICADEAADRVTVLQFVAQPADEQEAAPSGSGESIRDKYGVSGGYFFLPNQFWIHKNHLVAFDAVRLLKARGVEILLLCSGNLRDYRFRGTGYAEKLQEFISSNQLEGNIKILGLIEYADVVALMRECLAVLNPSRFEGWSSTVEEAKSLGQRLVLSSIPVHLEQDPPAARYFAPDDVSGLARILEEIWRSSPEGRPRPAVSLSEARAALHRRTLAYGRAYMDLVRRVEASPRSALVEER